MNFIAGGMMGDFIHSLSVVKNLTNNGKIYIANGYGDVWKFDLATTYKDLIDLMKMQDYIASFDILPNDFKEEFIDLTKWRTTLEHTDAGYTKCWSEVLADCYNYKVPKEYKWLNAKESNISKNKVVLHRSKHRLNGAFPWKRIMSQITQEMIFVTSDPREWELFTFKQGVTPVFVNTISEMADIINSCDLFVGNQSAPFSIACALDKPRIVELDYDPAKFYMDENRYSANISWFLNENNKYNAPLLKEKV